MFVETIFKRPSRIGIIFGMVFMAYSLTPSLIPRSWAEQAAIAALSFLCGYGIGVGITALWRYLQLPVVPKAYQSRIAWILLAAAAIFLLFFVYRSLGWQNNVRQTVGLGPAKSVDPVRMLLLATVLSCDLASDFPLIVVARQSDRTPRQPAHSPPRRAGDRHCHRSAGRRLSDQWTCSSAPSLTCSMRPTQRPIARTMGMSLRRRHPCAPAVPTRWSPGNPWARKAGVLSARDRQQRTLPSFGARKPR